MARTIATASQDRIGPRETNCHAPRERHFSGIGWHARLALALALLVAGCGGPPPYRCTIDDLDYKMVSTREVFLERLAGCPIGGHG